MSASLRSQRTAGTAERGMVSPFSLTRPRSPGVPGSLVGSLRSIGSPNSEREQIDIVAFTGSPQAGPAVARGKRIALRTAKRTA